ncbi:MAG: RdgB/HAM1 family non-canonical purine NTP pyrophosphatase [Calditrichaeota bacterium]|nr:RdgB/HAM1 family non-canonical purine NTP pyrophosphatase [Calditrichota bacterium]
MEILVATGNKHKLQEIREILGDLPVTVKSIADLPRKIEVEENGKTFAENAAIKARAYYDLAKMPVMADDSGLEVPALNNQPGIYSARFAGADADYAENNRLLLRRMAHLKKDRRKARFVCTVCFKTEKGEWFFTGITEGLILDELRGEGGFGYDPLFWIPELEQTYAELSPEEKNRISHRARALMKFKTFLKDYFKAQ